MKNIKLTQGKFAMVDDDDFEWLNQWKWYYVSGYARRWKITGFYKKEIVVMHRIIIGVKKEEEVDHIDRNKLNNQKINLRICTHSENMMNKDIRADNTSGYKGVHYNNGKWQARIMVGNKRISLGHFKTPEEAASAYDEAAKIHYKEFANPNSYNGK